MLIVVYYTIVPVM